MKRRPKPTFEERVLGDLRAMAAAMERISADLQDLVDLLYERDDPKPGTRYNDGMTATEHERKT